MYDSMKLFKFKFTVQGVSVNKSKARKEDEGNLWQFSGDPPI